MTNIHHFTSPAPDPTLTSTGPPDQSPLPVHLLPDLTIDLSGTRLPIVAKNVTQPTAPVYLMDHWKYVNRGRPWFHLRYHSTAPLDEDDFPPHHLSRPGDPAKKYLTLHLFVVHQLDEVGDDTSYLHPHETYDSGRLAKVFGVSLEVSDYRYHPQDVCDTAEVEYLRRKIKGKKAASTLEFRDFLTDEPLGVRVVDDSIDLSPLPDLLFTEIEVRETKKAAHVRRWAERKKALLPDSTAA